MNGVADGEAPPSPHTGTLTFTRGDLAEAWGLATQSSVPVRERPTDDVPISDDADLLVEEEQDDRVPLAASSAKIASWYGTGTSEPAPAPAPRLERRTIALIVGFFVLAFLAVAAGVALKWASSHDEAPSKPATDGQSDPDASIVPVRCEVRDRLGFFIGSLTNRANEPIRYRVDVTFTDRGGEPVGKGTQTTDFVVAGGTTSLDVSAGLSGDDATCRVVATRLPR